MKKRMNCWLRGLMWSAAVLSLVWVPSLLANGIPGNPGVSAAAALAVLAIGTLVMGCIERWRQHGSEKREQ